jgi:hypothetical protein
MAKPKQKRLSPLDVIYTLEAQERSRERAYAAVSPAKSGSNVEEPIIINPPTAIERWTLKAIEVVVYIMISILLAAIGFAVLAGPKLTDSSALYPTKRTSMRDVATSLMGPKAVIQMPRRDHLVDE